MSRQSGGRINNPYGGREHGPEKIIKGYVIDARTTRKLLGIKEREMSAKSLEVTVKLSDLEVFQSLLRVARTAKLYLEHGEPCLAEELEKYLKEVEHLL